MTKRIKNADRTGTTSPYLRIPVTQEIIDQSCQRDSSHCMIAEAVSAAYPRAKYISVDLATIRFTDPQAGMRYVYLTPRGAQIALLAFDQGEKVDPFTINLRDAHVLLSGNAKNARAELKPHTKAGGEGGNVPIRVGGKTPPQGPLYGESKDSPVPGGGPGRGTNRTGKRREFGLRAIIR